MAHSPTFGPAPVRTRRAVVPDLNEIFERIDRERLTGQINIFRSEDRWQVSMKRPKGGSAFSVSIKPGLVEALVACLGPETGFVRGLASYWHHPESSSVFIVPAGEELPNDPICDEIDHTEYVRLHELYVGDAESDNDDAMSLI